MKRIILCGHTGSANRGCEAIVRSTCALIKRHCPGAEIILATHSLRQDLSAGLDATVDGFIEYARLGGLSLPRLRHAFYCKILRDERAAQGVVQQRLWDEIGPQTLLLNIGGDTYCYGRPVLSYELNRAAEEKGARTVLFGCSVGRECIDGEMREDLKRYSLIIARESDTYNNLLGAGIGEDRLRLYPDPAFSLETSDTGYAAPSENTVGINLSPIVSESGSGVLNAYDALIGHIIKNTDMRVLLIPHVYGRECPQDLVPLGELYNRYALTGRVDSVQEELDCRSLKGIIGHCRLFVGARTHSVIAAYSSRVPALAVGYSMKAAGIAKDVFGDSSLAPHGASLTRPGALTEAFEDMRRREDELREHLNSFMPEYISRTEGLGQEISEALEHVG